MTWTVTVEEDGDDFILPLPDDLLEQAGWKIGDTLVWDVRPNGRIFLSKKEENGSERNIRSNQDGEQL